jgi:biotin carboxyl carrier protein
LATVKVESAGRGVYIVEHDGVRHTVYVAGPPGRRWAFWNGQVFRQQAAPGRDSRLAGASRLQPAGPEVITAPMPGTIRNVLVEPGARVRKGDTLVVLEAMKMEIPLRAQRDAIVTRVRCRLGEIVAPDAELVELA